jgi:hypothetical protein
MVPEYDRWKRTSFATLSAMGEGLGGSLGIATLEGSDSTDPIVNGTAVEAPPLDRVAQSELDAGRRRFTIAAVVAIVLTAVPFVWILWSLWGPTDPLRPSNYQDNFYDLQARAMFHGHVWLANGSLGLEGFLHGGHTYTYFGLFPSIIRMPILALTSSLDGRLTAPYMLLAWLVTGVFTALLLWRVRFLVRGSVAMERGEAAAFGVLVATVMGGTIWMLLAATPFVFNEDIAWSICLTVGSIFALLGVIERPSWGRVVASGALILCANLDRSTTGWACAVGAGLIAIWFGVGRGGRENRRWCLPVFAAGLVPLVIGCIVNYSKFGVFFGVSNFEQVWTHVNAYRRKFLAANHDAEEGIIFVPTNIVTYLRPNGLRLTSVFPFITLPPSPPSALSGVLFDRRYRTASLPASSPLLFLLSLWGLVTAFRPRPIGKVVLTRLLLLAAGSAAAALMLWGYIAPRYLGDFVPFLALASAVAMADIWRRLEVKRRSMRVGALVVITAAALFSIGANIGMAVTPNEEWNSTQALGYVQAQKTVSDLTGHPLNSRVVRGSSLPTWGPADQLYVIGDCDGLYISNGEDYSTVPSEQFVRTTWLTVERGHGFQHTFRLTVNSPAPGRTESVSLVSAGKYTVAASAARAPGRHRVWVSFGVYGPGRPSYGISAQVSSGTSHKVVVVTDPVKHLVSVTMDGTTYLSSLLVNGTPIYVDAASTHSQGVPPALSAINETASSPEPTLCQSLIP